MSSLSAAVQNRLALFGPGPGSRTISAPRSMFEMTELQREYVRDAAHIVVKLDPAFDGVFRVLPMKETDCINLRVETSPIIETDLAQLAPVGAPARLLQAKTSVVKVTLQRFTHGMRIAFETYNSKRGETEMAAKMKGLFTQLLQTMGYNALMTMMITPDARTEKVPNILAPGANIDQAFSYFRNCLGVANRSDAGPNIIALLNENLRVTPNFVYIGQGLAAVMASDPALCRFFNVGNARRAIAQGQGNAIPEEAFPSVEVYSVKSIALRDRVHELDTVNPLDSTLTAGAFAVMTHVPTSDPYKSAARTAYLRDRSKGGDDHFSPVELIEAIRTSCFFDERGALSPVHAAIAANPQRFLAENSLNHSGDFLPSMTMANGPDNRHTVCQVFGQMTEAAFPQAALRHSSETMLSRVLGLVGQQVVKDFANGMALIRRIDSRPLDPHGEAFIRKVSEGTVISKAGLHGGPALVGLVDLWAGMPDVPPGTFIPPGCASGPGIASIGELIHELNSTLAVAIGRETIEVASRFTDAAHTIYETLVGIIDPESPVVSPVFTPAQFLTEATGAAATRHRSVTTFLTHLVVGARPPLYTFMDAAAPNNMATVKGSIDAMVATNAEKTALKDLASIVGLPQVSEEVRVIFASIESLEQFKADLQNSAEVATFLRMDIPTLQEVTVETVLDWMKMISDGRRLAAFTKLHVWHELFCIIARLVSGRLQVPAMTHEVGAIISNAIDIGLADSRKPAQRNQQGMSTCLTRFVMRPDLVARFNTGKTQSTARCFGLGAREDHTHTLYLPEDLNKLDFDGVQVEMFGYGSKGNRRLFNEGSASLRDSGIFINNDLRRRFNSAQVNHGSVLMNLFTRIVLLSPFTLQTLERWYNNDVGLPVDVILMRPNVKFTTSTVIAVNGDDFGDTWYVNPQMTEAVSSQAGVTQFNQSCYFGSVIYRNDHFYRIPHALIRDCQSGYGVRFHTPGTFHSAPDSADIVSMIVPFGTKVDDTMTVDGKWPSEVLNGVVPPQEVQRLKSTLQHPSALYYAVVYGMSKVKPNFGWDVKRGARPTVVFREDPQSRMPDGRVGYYQTPRVLLGPINRPSTAPSYGGVHTF